MKPPKRLYILTSILCAISTTGFIFVQGQLDHERLPRERMAEKLIYIPGGKVIKTASLGFHAVLADIMWVRAVMYFGEHYLTDKDYDWLYNLLDATTTLDPKNILAYRFGGTLLALEQGDVEKSIAILKKGIRENPDADWRLYFLLGFNYFYYLNDYDSAAKYLDRASRMPGHPNYLPRLAARMYAKSDRPDVAIEFLEEMYHQHDDENVRAAISDQLNTLNAQKQAHSPSHAEEKQNAF